MNMLLRGIAIITLLVSHVAGYVSPLNEPPRPPRKHHGLRDKKVAVLGTAGYSGALAFGFLQRVASQYGTGIGEVASIGATMESSTHLNRVLTKSFQNFINDDDRAILSTNLFSVDAITESLRGCHAIVMGTDIGIAVREVTPGTFKTSNGVTCEVYWPAPSNLDAIPENYSELRLMIIKNILDAARMVGIEHICLVDDAKDYSVLQDIHATGIPYTCLGPTAIEMVAHPNYNHKLGVLERLEAVGLQENEEVPCSRYLHREDMVMLAIQSLMSMDWTKSRCLAVTGLGYAEGTWKTQQQRPDDNAENGAVFDTEWCHNAYLLKEALGLMTWAFVH